MKNNSFFFLHKQHILSKVLLGYCIDFNLILRMHFKWARISSKTIQFFNQTFVMLENCSHLKHPETIALIAKMHFHNLFVSNLAYRWKSQRWFMASNEKYITKSFRKFMDEWRVCLCYFFTSKLLQLSLATNKRNDERCNV